jgi:hypothetical protein
VGFQLPAPAATNGQFGEYNAAVSPGGSPMAIAGSCKLCLQERELLESHFIPAALYPRGKELQFLSSDGVGTVTEEMKAHLLCRDCEMRFDQNGESEVLRWIVPKLTKRFPPLFERLRLACPREQTPDLARFAGYDLGFDMDKFAYFAVSVAWRASVHDWTLPNGTTMQRIPLGQFGEDMRRYLLVETSLPPAMAVIVIVSSDEQSRKMWFVPDEWVEANCLNVRFITRGIMFRVMMGYQMPRLFQDLSCTSPRKCIFYGNAEKRIKETADRFAQWNART